MKKVLIVLVLISFWIGANAQSCKIGKDKSVDIDECFLAGENVVVTMKNNNEYPVRVTVQITVTYAISKSSKTCSYYNYESTQEIIEKREKKSITIPIEKEHPADKDFIAKSAKAISILGSKYVKPKKGQ